MAYDENEAYIKITDGVHQIALKALFRKEIFDYCNLIAQEMSKRLLLKQAALTSKPSQAEASQQLSTAVSASANGGSDSSFASKLPVTNAEPGKMAILDAEPGKRAIQDADLGKMAMVAAVASPQPDAAVGNMSQAPPPKRRRSIECIG